LFTFLFTYCTSDTFTLTLSTVSNIGDTYKKYEYNEIL
jgi:hypothetical protein